MDDITERNKICYFYGQSITPRRLWLLHFYFLVREFANIKIDLQFVETAFLISLFSGDCWIQYFLALNLYIFIKHFGSLSWKIYSKFVSWECITIFNTLLMHTYSLACSYAIFDVMTWPFACMFYLTNIWTHVIGMVCRYFLLTIYLLYISIISSQTRWKSLHNSILISPNYLNHPFSSV